MKKVLVIGIGHTGLAHLASKAFQDSVTMVDLSKERKKRIALKNVIENPFYDSSERKRAQWKDEVHYGKRKGRQR